MNTDTFMAFVSAVSEGVSALEEEYAKAAEERLPSLKALLSLGDTLTPDHTAYQALHPTLSKIRQELAGVPQDVYRAYEGLIRGIDADVQGIAHYVRMNSLSIPEAFARTVAAVGLTPILPQAPEPQVPAADPPKKSKKVHEDKPKESPQESSETVS